MEHSSLIFDLDGTLADSLPGITAALNRALSGLSLPTHSQQAVRGFIGNGSRILMQRAAPDDAGEELVDALEQRFKQDYDATWPEGTVPYPGIPELLADLQQRGIPLAVLSNKPHPFTVTMVGRIFSGIHFASVLGQRPGIPHKPDPAGALEILRHLGKTVDEAIFIGDSTIDLETSRRAGMRSITCGWGYHDADHLLAAGAEQIVMDAGELRSLLD